MSRAYLKRSSVGLFLSFIISGSLAAQGNALFPEESEGLAVPTDRDNLDGFEREAGVPLEIQKVCPPAAMVEHQRDSLVEPWNKLEIGLMIEPTATSIGEPQVYTRYTCMRPIDRP